MMEACVAGSGKRGDRELEAVELPPRPGAATGEGAEPSGLEDRPTTKHPTPDLEPQPPVAETVRRMGGRPLDRELPRPSLGQHSLTRRLPPREDLFEADTIAETPEPRERREATVALPAEPWGPEVTPVLPPPAPPPPPAPSPPPEAPSRYELVGEHARGGQARVLLVWDRALDREVAWKEASPRRRPGQDAAEVARELADAERRLLTEARITGQLEHPSIVPVYELDWNAQGRPYYTMRRIRGEDLSKVLGRQLSLRERSSLLGHFLDLCHAIAFAHSRGVIHRDIKPHNVMIGAFGETVLLDWGLARRRASAGADPSTSLEVRPLQHPGQGDGTLAGSLMGTPAYMSPEQARGETERVDERTDIWGLGAVLYEILAGRAPHVGASQAEILRLAEEGVVPRVLDLCPGAPPELAAIAHKALRADPAARYPSAQALAEDINAYLTGGRVSVFRYDLRARLRRTYRRHRTASLAVLLAVVVTLAALVAVTVAWSGERAAHAQEREEKRLASLTAAEAHLREADRLQVQHRPLSAGVHGAAALLANPTYPASPLYDADFAARHAAGGQGWLDALSHVELARLGPIAGLERELAAGDVVHRVGFAAGGGTVVATDYRGHLMAWDLGRGRVIADRPACAPGSCMLAVASDGEHLVTAGRTGRVAWWRLGASAPEWEVELGTAGLRALTVDASDALIAAAGEEGMVHLLRASDGRRLQELAPEVGPIGALAFSPDGEVLAVGTLGGAVALVDRSGHRPSRSVPDSAGSWSSLSFTPDGRRLMGSGSGERAVIWDLAHGSTRLSDGDAHLSSAALSPDGATVAVGGYDGVVRLWDSVTGQLLGTAAAHREGVLVAAFSPDGQRLATAGLDGLVRVWDVARPAQPQQLVAGSPTRGLVLSELRPWLVTACVDDTVRAFDTRTGEVVRAVPTGPEPVVAIALGWDERALITAHEDRSVHVWDLDSGEHLGTFAEHTGAIRGLVGVPGGPRMISAGRDGRVTLLDLASGEARTLVQDDAPIWGLTLSPDGRSVAAGDAEGRVRLWSVEDGSSLLELAGHDDWVTGVAFSADGRRIASAGKDARVMLWDAESGERLAELSGHRRWVNDVAFSADGRRLVTAGDDGLVILWDVASARPLLRIRRPGIAFSVGFLPDGESFAFLEGHRIHIVPLARYDVAHPLPGPLLLETLARGGLSLDGLDVTPARLVAPSGP
jgi:WD40 repeat protein/tRNA A-37 threonylcarbamoyl transferase component Bud32